MARASFAGYIELVLQQAERRAGSVGMRKVAEVETCVCLGTHAFESRCAQIQVDAEWAFKLARNSAFPKPSDKAEFTEVALPLTILIRAWSHMPGIAQTLYMVVSRRIARALDELAHQHRTETNSTSSADPARPEFPFF